MNINLDYMNAYRRLKELFTVPGKFKDKGYRLEMNPIKQSFDCTGDLKGNMERYTNVMYARTENGIFTKVIAIDDRIGFRDVKEEIVYVDNNLNVTCVENLFLTTVRCGMMAALAIDFNQFGKPDTKVGFIGNGKINQQTAMILSAQFGIHEFVIRGRFGYRSRNKEVFEKYGNVQVDESDDLSILNTCDVIVSCTNSNSKSNLVSNADLSEPRLFITQDCGYLLDESFRDEAGMSCFTDHPEQLYEHYREEFPFDDALRYFELMRETNDDGRKSVYLYGIAIADAIVFEEMCLRGDAKWRLSEAKPKS